MRDQGNESAEARGLAAELGPTRWLMSAGFGIFPRGADIHIREIVVEGLAESVLSAGKKVADKTDADEAENLALTRLERHLIDRQESSEPLGQAVDREHFQRMA